jgi:hypothetical protein
MDNAFVNFQKVKYLCEIELLILKKYLNTFTRIFLLKYCAVYLITVYQIQHTTVL